MSRVKTFLTLSGELHHRRPCAGESAATFRLAPSSIQSTTSQRWLYQDYRYQGLDSPQRQPQYMEVLLRQPASRYRGAKISQLEQNGDSRHLTINNTTYACCAATPSSAVWS